MKLSELAYNCVKNVNHYDDDGFTLEKFIQINDPNDSESSSEDYFDYSVAINNVFAPINEAIARLSDLDRIPCRVEKMSSVNGIIDLSTLTLHNHPCKEVVNVALIDKNYSYDYFKLNVRPFGVGKIYVVYPVGLTSEDVYVEYKEDIKYLTRNDIRASVEVGIDGETIDWGSEIELRDFGITDSMCNYIIEYAKGVLLEQIDASLANMHITRAEQYFNNIKVAQQAFSQQVVSKKYSVR